MIYHNVRDSTFLPVASTAAVLSDGGGWKREVGARCLHLIGAPLPVITGPVDGLIGIGSGIGSILTFGKEEQLEDFSNDHFEGFNSMFSDVFLQIIRAINPRSPLSLQVLNTDGLLNESFSRKLRALGARHNCWTSDNLLKRHVITRLIVLGEIVQSPLLRIADMVIGLGSTIASIATLGCFEKVNTLAYSGLRPQAFASDLIEGLRAFFHP